MKSILDMRFLAPLAGLLLIFSCTPADGPDTDASSADGVQLTKADNHVEVSINGKPFTTYYFGEEAPKPYLHPLRSAKGTVVTRGFPMRTDIEGETQDHPHHRALYFAHGDINGVDFWAEGQPQGRKVEVAAGRRYVEEGMPRGRAVFKKLLSAENGEISAQFDLVDPRGDKVLGEMQQTYVFHADEGSRVIDCEFTLTAGADAVKLGDTKEGTFAIRVVDALREKEGLVMVNSEGGKGEKEIWGKPAPWVDYSGTVEGESLGIAIFDHPGNPKHPTYWHARGYGLFAANPFGEHHFFNDETRDGSVTIEPGTSFTLRYRVVIHPGDAEEAKVAELYESYKASLQ